MFKYAICCLMLLSLSSLAGYTGFGVSDLVILDLVDPDLELLSPVGGETWYGTCGHDILWSASDAYLDPGSVCLWYSQDGGNTYTPIAENTFNDGSETWYVPWINTNNALIKIRVEDGFGNASEQASPSCFSVISDLPQEPQAVTVQASGVHDIVITWEPVDQTVNGYPFISEGYIVLHSPDPCTPIQNYQFLGITAGLSYTHQGVLDNRAWNFYRVIAYNNLNFDRRFLLPDMVSQPVNPYRFKGLPDVTGGQK